VYEKEKSSKIAYYLVIRYSQEERSNRGVTIKQYFADKEHIDS
jgi:hypothetical protein